MNLEITTLDNPAILLAVNNAAVPDVGPIDALKAEWMVAHCVVPGLAMLDGHIAGIVAVYSDACGYNSDCYRLFTERYDKFLYIDRVIVAFWARGRGVARKLYKGIEQVALAQKLAVVADVYSNPPNIPSLELHHTMGYQEVGTQYFPATDKTASKLMKYVEHARATTRH